MFNRVMMVSLNGVEKPLLVRFNETAKGGQQFGVEKLLAPRLRERGVPSPELHYAGEYRGHLFAVFDYVEGKRLDEVLGNPQTSSREKRRCLVALGTALANLHSIKGTGYGMKFDGVTYKIGETEKFHTDLFETAIQKLATVDQSISARFAKAAKEVWLPRLKEQNSDLSAPRLVHNDIHGPNVLVTDNGVSLVDWDGVSWRNFERDLSLIVHLNLRNDREGINALIDSYIASSGQKIDKGQLLETVGIWTVHWLAYHAAQLHSVPSAENAYFGTAASNLKLIADFIDKTAPA